MSVQLHPADCREVMRAMAPCSVDAIVTDPPYEIGFMGAAWDSSSIAFDREVWSEALRVLKPGGHVLAFGATRTWHWLACALELSGFESRGSIAWIQGQGMPHGLDVSKAIDAAAGAEREVLGTIKGTGNKQLCGQPDGKGYGPVVDITAPATPDAEHWAGWNTQLAPSHEPIAFFRKPMEGNTVSNVLAHGVGALNVDACRLGGDRPQSSAGGIGGYGSGNDGARYAKGTGRQRSDVGRWSPNVALDEAAAAQLDAMVGKRKSGAQTGKQYDRHRATAHGAESVRQHGVRPASEQGPSAFFYCPKAATREREQGCDHLRWAADSKGKFAGRAWTEGDRLLVDGKGQPILNPHSTTKPLALMRWLVRLITPPGGLVLDPFMGSGTTGVAAVREGFRFVGCDINDWAHAIATARVRWAQGLGPRIEELAAAGPAQVGLFT